MPVLSVSSVYVVAVSPLKIEVPDDILAAAAVIAPLSHKLAALEAAALDLGLEVSKGAEKTRKARDPNAQRPGRKPRVAHIEPAPAYAHAAE